MSFSRPGRGAACAATALVAALGSIAFANPPDPQAADPTGDSLARRLTRTGFENVTVERRDEAWWVAFENRRLRYSAEALGELTRVVPGRLHAYERRLGLVAARVDTSAQGFRVAYPGDRDYAPPPAGPAHSSTRWRADLDVGPIVNYEVGRLFDPFLVRVEIETRLRVNPWPGGLASAALLIPIRNDFEPTELDPDIDQIRPGPINLQQFAWLPRAGLLSASAGSFWSNRYGGSLGIARPMSNGALLFDAQADLTGFLAFPQEGVIYSTADHFSGYAGLTWRPPLRSTDLALRARVAQFLYGDRGVELEVRRTMGDLEVAYFLQNTDQVPVYGIRLRIPIPPAERASGVPLRIQPVRRFPLDFRDKAAPIGEFLSGVASREDFLRQLNGPSLDAQADRFHGPGQDSGAPAAGAARTSSGEVPVSITGMTGFILTPWAGVMADRRFEMGYGRIEKEWAYDHRGQNANEIYYATLGFLPHVEASLRWTHIVGLMAFQGEVPESRLADVDRMASFRLELVPPKVLRPGLSVGIEDAEGTRRFHSTYAVTGTELKVLDVKGRVTLGLGVRIFEAANRTLDGGFGALEITPWRNLAAQVEFDSEKWNAAARIALPLGFRVRAALLHLESPSFGAGWTVAL